VLNCILIVLNVAELSKASGLICIYMQGDFILYLTVSVLGE